jgi:hypothetical protein
MADHWMWRLMVAACTCTAHTKELGTFGRMEGAAVALSSRASDGSNPFYDPPAPPPPLCVFVTTLLTADSEKQARVAAQLDTWIGHAAESQAARVFLVGGDARVLRAALAPWQGTASTAARANVLPLVMGGGANASASASASTFEHNPDALTYQQVRGACACTR